MKIIDLFAGAGGLSEGFRNENFDVLFHIEMDTEAAQTLKTRESYFYLKTTNQLKIYKKYISGKISQNTLYSYVPNHLLRKVIVKEISSKSVHFLFKKIDNSLKDSQLDGIIGGPPCQAFSMIGRKSNLSKKADDSRIYLYQYYIKFLKRYQPKFFVFENVKGLKSFKDFRGELLLPQILNAFENVGYNCEYKVLNSLEYAVPQKRERIFIFGYRKDLPEIDFFSLLSKKKEMPVTLNKLFLDLPEIASGQTLNEYKPNIEPDYIMKYYRIDNLPLSHNTARPHSSRDLQIYKIVSEAKQKGIQTKYIDLPENLRTHSNITSFSDRFKALDYKGFSHTVVAHIAKDGHYYIHPDVNQNRSITVREAARIQTFRDDYYFEGSRTSAFKQIGNAVPPKLSMKISETIADLLVNNNI